MKSDKELKKQIDEVCQNDSVVEKKKLFELLRSKNRLNLLKDTISIQNEMLDLMEPLAISEARKKRKSLESRTLKKRIVTEALKMVFAQYPKAQKTLGSVWIKLDRLKDRKIHDLITKTDYKLCIQGDELHIHGDDPKMRLKYKKRSLQPFIDAMK